MIDTRRRPPASTISAPTASQGSMPRRGGASVRSMSSGSMTPMEDEEDRPKRSTRGRNPLPPTKGPLFPPLPPKPIRAKSSPKASQGSEGGNHQLPAQEPEDDEEENAAAGPSGEQIDPSEPTQAAGDEVHASAADKPSWSDRSLTPAPPSDNVEVVLPTFSNGRNRRGDALNIKVEDDEEQEGEDVGDTPKQNRATRGRLAPNTNGDPTPTRSVSSDGGANGAGPRTSLGRRRRGEEQLLLDDHLLPVEIRRTGSLSGRRKSQAADVVEKQELIDAIEADGDGEVGDVEEEKDVEAEQDGEALEVGNEMDELPGDDIIEQDIVDPDEEDPEDGDGEEVTRCVCQLEDGDPLMVACDKCNVWQHGPCVGIWADEEAPDEYFCERCRPELHGPLRKWMRSKGRNIAHFTPPSPEDLKTLHANGDRYPPSQSKRWSMPSKSKAPIRGRAKEAASPIDQTDPRRLSRRGELPANKAPPAPTSHREKSAKAEPVRPGREHRRGSSHHRKASVGSRSPRRDSRSPTATTKDRDVRKRSTMNSRDAAFEDAVQAAIEASRREMGDEDGEGEGEEVLMADDVDEGVEEKERERDTEKKNKGKRKREEDIDPENPSSQSAHPKIKHPNQYTYRPKPASSAPILPPAPSPARRPAQASTPVPQAPPPALHEHGTRRAGALANGAREAPFIAVSVTHLGWHLPDYLSSFSDIFPSPNPTPLQVRSPRTLPPIPKNHFLNHRYGPFSEDRAMQEGEEQAGLVLPPDPAEREAIGNKGETHTEPPARMKYPQRRVTTGDMRKRVKHMLEFCGRVEIEEGKRSERKGKLGIPDADLEEAIAAAEEEDGGQKDGPRDLEGDMEMETGDASTSKLPIPSSPSDPVRAPKPTSTSSGPTAAQLLAELTADLVDFQETWARGGFAPAAVAGPSSSAGGWAGAAGYGGYSPVPPGSATFAHAGNGWPTSGLGRDVVGPEQEQEEGFEAEPEAEAGGVSLAGTDEAELPLPADPADLSVGGQPEDQGSVDAAIEMEIPVDVYRQGEVVGVVSTTEEEEAVERIKENTERDVGRMEADEAEQKALDVGTEINGDGQKEREMDDAVALLQGVGVPAGNAAAHESEMEVDADGDVVMDE